MRSANCIPLLASAAAALSTPPGWEPSANATLGINFGNIRPNPYSVENPTQQDTTQKYMIFMLDLNIPDLDVTTADEYDTLVLSIVANTKTRLHWWGGNYTVDPTTGASVNSSDSLSQYTAPRPRDHRWHNYFFNLFNQQEDYTPSAEVLAGVYYSQIADTRFNIGITPIVEAVGQPNYGQLYPDE